MLFRFGLFEGGDFGVEDLIFDWVVEIDDGIVNGSFWKLDLLGEGLVLVGGNCDVGGYGDWEEVVFWFVGFIGEEKEYVDLSLLFVLV